MDEARRAALYVDIGLQQGLFTRAQADGALAQASPDRPVGEVLLAQGVIRKSQHRGLERAVAYRAGRDEDKRFAEVVVESRYCSQPQVEAGLERQKEHYARTGQLLRLPDALVDAGALSPTQALAAEKICRYGNLEG